MRSRPAAAFGLLLAAAAVLLPGLAAQPAGARPAAPPAFAEAGRIVGPGSKPAPAAGAVVALTESEADGGKVFCTGTLVAENAVLTAAHCFPADRTGGLVLIGTADLPYTEGCPPTPGVEYETHHIRDVFVPDVYDGGGKHDLAIARLRTPATSVKPAKLGLNNKALKRCRTGTTSGWGYTETDTFTEGNADVVDTRPRRLQTATREHRARARARARGLTMTPPTRSGCSANLEREAVCEARCRWSLVRVQNQRLFAMPHVNLRGASQPQHRAGGRARESMRPRGEGRRTDGNVERNERERASAAETAAAPSSTAKGGWRA